MKYEETNDITTIFVHTTDERSSVVNWLSQLAGDKPVLVVLSADAPFRRPGDLRELEQVMAHQERDVFLVIEGNERLRQWARRQGYTVFSTVDACLKTLTQQRIVRPIGTLVAQSQWLTDGGVESVREVIADPYCSADARGETYLPASGLFNSRRTSVQTWGSDTDAYTALSRASFAPRNTEPLDVGEIPTHPPALAAAVWSGASSEPYRGSRAQALTLAPTKPMDLAFLQDLPGSVIVSEEVVDAPVHVDYSVARNRVETVSVAENVMVDDLMKVGNVSLPAAVTAQIGWSDKLLLLLVTLLGVGIAGGVGFGYLLSMAYSVARIVF
jgi:hypothetical protein